MSRASLYLSFGARNIKLKEFAKIKILLLSILALNSVLKGVKIVAKLF
jgi:hypothetical protein